MSNSSSSNKLINFESFINERDKLGKLITTADIC